LRRWSRELIGTDLIYPCAGVFFPVIWSIDRALEIIHRPFDLVRFVFSFRPFSWIVVAFAWIGFDLFRIGDFGKSTTIAGVRYLARVYKYAFVLFLHPQAPALAIFMMGFHPVACFLPALFRASENKNEIVCARRVAFALATTEFVSKRSSKIWGWSVIDRLGESASNRIWETTIRLAWILVIVSFLQMPTDDYLGDMISYAQSTLDQISITSSPPRISERGDDDVSPS
jgi:hypothetical protein